MKKVAVSVVLFILTMFLSSNVFAVENIRKITVTGKSEITLDARLAVIQVEIKQINMEMAQSYSEISKTIEKLNRGLKSIGLTDEEIRKSFILQGRECSWEHDSEVFKGYYSKCMIDIYVNDINNMSSVYQELSHYKNITIRNTDYKRDDYFNIREKEFDKALQAARKKAEHMAQVLNVKIGKVHSIQELGPENIFQGFNSNVAQVQYIGTENSGYGTIKIVASVIVEFELE
jgi:uncharacterized protein YggE